MIDIKLDSITHDIVLQDGDIVLIDGIDSIKQGLTIRLAILIGEWFLDNRIGLIDVRSDKPDHDDLVIRCREEILKEDGVTSLEEFEGNFNTRTRVSYITFKCTTIYGDLSLEGVEV